MLLRLCRVPQFPCSPSWVLLEGACAFSDEKRLLRNHLLEGRRGSFKHKAGWHRLQMGAGPRQEQGPAPGKLPGSPCASPTFPALPLGTWVAGLALAGAGGPMASPVPCMLGAPLTSLAPGHGHAGWAVAGPGLQGEVPVSRGVWSSLSLGLNCLLGGRRASLGEGWAAPTPRQAGAEGQRDGRQGAAQAGASDALY